MFLRLLQSKNNTRSEDTKGSIYGDEKDNPESILSPPLVSQSAPIISESMRYIAEQTEKQKQLEDVTSSQRAIGSFTSEALSNINQMINCLSRGRWKYVRESQADYAHFTLHSKNLDIQTVTELTSNGVFIDLRGEGLRIFVINAEKLTQAYTAYLAHKTIKPAAY